MSDRGTVTGPHGTRLAWKAEGEGVPLVFCNGLANDAFQWGMVLEKLGGKGRLITWDYPGHGDSDPMASKRAV